MPRWNTSNKEDTGPLVELAQQAAHPLEDSTNLDDLMDRIGDARIVMLGEASHGTSDFYTWRSRLSQRLIREKGYSFISVEGDWPDCYQINRLIKHYPNAGESAYRVLHAFERWPTWMWANWEMVALVDWLSSYNAKSSRQAGFYGLDVYSLYESMHAIVDYLENKDPEMARLARQAYRCFEPYAEDVQAYAWSTRMAPQSCEDEVLKLLAEMRQRGPHYDGDPEAGFNAEQNALVMANAENYYRAMVRSDQNSWNVRDTHMIETLERLMNHHGDHSRGIVWAHNTHVGDARFTDMAAEGMVNIGQMARERWGEENVFLLGCGTHHGTVIAGQAWDAPMQVMGVPDAVEGSWEDILHRVGQPAFYLFTRDWRQDQRAGAMRGNRAIGVVYNPEFERYGNYVPTQLPFRYDAFLFMDETAALHPLHMQAEKEVAVPDTYPWGL